MPIRTDSPIMNPTTISDIRATTQAAKLFMTTGGLPCKLNEIEIATTIDSDILYLFATYLSPSPGSKKITVETRANTKNKN